VRWGTGAGSDAFRDDLSRSLTSTLGAGCFATVTVASSEGEGQKPDVDFDVLLSNIVEETVFDDSIAGALQPGEPTKELRRTASFEVTVDARLSARASGAVLQTKHLVSQVTHRPMYVGEDPQARARADAIQNIVRDLTRALGCGKSKLTEKIRDAVGDAAQSGSASR
jgi:hypothetical protein